MRKFRALNRGRRGFRGFRDDKTSSAVALGEAARCSRGPCRKIRSSGARARAINQRAQPSADKSISKFIELHLHPKIPRALNNDSFASPSPPFEMYDGTPRTARMHACTTSATFTHALSARHVPRIFVAARSGVAGKLRIAYAPAHVISTRRFRAGVRSVTQRRLGST